MTTSRPSARQSVRDDAAAHGWELHPVRVPTLDAFTLGSYQVNAFWDPAHPETVGRGARVFYDGREVAVISGRLSIVDTRALLGSEWVSPTTDSLKLLKTRIDVVRAALAHAREN